MVVGQAQKKKDQQKVDALKKKLQEQREKRRRGEAEDSGDDEEQEPDAKKSKADEEEIEAEHETPKFDAEWAQEYLSETQIEYLTKNLKAVNPETFEIKLNDATGKIRKIGEEGRKQFSPLLLMILIEQGVVRVSA